MALATTSSLCITGGIEIGEQLAWKGRFWNGFDLVGATSRHGYQKPSRDEVTIILIQPTRVWIVPEEHHCTQFSKRRVETRPLSLQ